MIDKNTIRQQIKQKKAIYEKSVLLKESQSVIDILETDKDFVEAKTILMYYSLPDEVQTIGLIEKYKNVKNILLPSVNGDNLSLHMYTPYSELKPGKYGIFELNGQEFDDYETINLAIIPGVAFDKSFNRLGRGKGFYDRLLPKLNCKTIGICFDFQFLDYIPSEYHDCKVDKIIHGFTVVSNNN